MTILPANLIFNVSIFVLAWCVPLLKVIIFLYIVQKNNLIHLFQFHPSIDYIYIFSTGAFFFKKKSIYIILIHLVIERWEVLISINLYYIYFWICRENAEILRKVEFQKFEFCIYQLCIKEVSPCGRETFNIVLLTRIHVFSKCYWISRLDIL